MESKAPFSKEIQTVINARKTDSNLIDIIEVLGYGPENFQNAFDIALTMDNLNLAKFLYSNFSVGKVVVEFTLLAKQHLHY